jgi:GR25 family glycosyltransferase involved in LPS biosynthesis
LIIEETRRKKLQEVTDMFLEQRFDDLNDMKVYQDLSLAVEKSIEKLHFDYENDDFAPTGSNLKFLRNIVSKVENLNTELLQTHKTFKKWERAVFFVEPD